MIATSYCNLKFEISVHLGVKPFVTNDLTMFWNLSFPTPYKKRKVLAHTYRESDTFVVTSKLPCVLCDSMLSFVFQILYS